YAPPVPVEHSCVHPLRFGPALACQPAGSSPVFLAQSPALQAEALAVCVQDILRVRVVQVVATFTRVKVGPVRPGSGTGTGSRGDAGVVGVAAASYLAGAHHAGVQRQGHDQGIVGSTPGMPDPPALRVHGSPVMAGAAGPQPVLPLLSRLYPDVGPEALRQPPVSEPDHFSLLPDRRRVLMRSRLQVRQIRRPLLISRLLPEYG